MVPMGKKRQWSPFRIILVGFLCLILVGAALLSLPISHHGGVSVLDALFTATSAVCVTGLVVQDTASCWTGFGQLVLLLLIQTGGMGVVTVAVAIAKASGRRIGLMERSTMQEAIAAPQVGGIVRLTSFILKTVFCVELAGAVLLAPAFCGAFGLGRGLWYAVFHSVSAFCNAGFDLMGVHAPFSSLTAYQTSPVVNLTIMALIISGGLGFITWDDLRQKRLHFRQYRMQTKVILSVTAMLICLPALYFYAAEPMGEGQAWGAIFQSVTTRTAGFNTVDLTALSEAGLMVMVVLMLVGGSPGSTAGGMKTTTLGVLMASAAAVFHRREEAHCFGRRIPPEAIRNAAAILLIYLTLCIGTALAISRMEGLPLMTCLFETASAIGTVGLSLGVTPTLGTVSRLLLILLMFFGRVGGLTLIFAALATGRTKSAHLPQEKITVG